MATLKHLQSGAVRPVPARLLVGRAPSSSLHLDDHRVSGQHASIVWTGGRWEARDLGSRNGTFVDGERLEPGKPVVLSVGATLAFGVSDEKWELVEAGPPSAVAEHVASGRVRIATDGILALPDGDAPLAEVFARGREWRLEMDGESRVLQDEEVVSVGGEAWRIRVPSAIEGTVAVDSGPSLSTVQLRFAVSMNEEHVELTLIHRGKETALEAREHGYTLLTLARARVDEAELPTGEQGWIDRDRLLRMLGVDANALNVSIYRARGQLAAAGLEGAAGIVEVRRGARRIGIDPERIEIVPL
ncbi:MAG: FHA domain-containing protein [Deltaproteobacteria bacterium]|nr:MAG: FHA domain-containing protein [Deltaproteobacteria bacterium]